jgi:hypothetical protein
MQQRVCGEGGVTDRFSENESVKERGMCLRALDSLKLSSAAEAGHRCELYVGAEAPTS